MRTLTPEEFQIERSKGTLILDVRQPEECAIAHIEGSVNIPLSDLPARVGELASNKSVAVLCHHGVRSAMALRFLEQQGFREVSHLGGGIDAWSLTIDPGVPRY